MSALFKAFFGWYNFPFGYKSYGFLRASYKNALSEMHLDVCANLLQNPLIFPLVLHSLIWLTVFLISKENCTTQNAEEDMKCQWFGFTSHGLLNLLY